MARVIPAAVAALALALFAYGLSSNSGDGMGSLGAEAAAGDIAGDVDCNGSVNSVDALKVLRFVAGLSVSQQPDCTLIGEGLTHIQGDVDCSDGGIPVSAVDALKILRYVAGLTVSYTGDCPHIGSAIGTATPTATGTTSPTPTGTASGSPTPTSTATPTPTPTANGTASASPTPTATATPTPTPTPTPTGTPTASPTPTATPTPTPTPTSTPSPTPTPTPSPSPTPSPTPPPPGPVCENVNPSGDPPGLLIPDEDLTGITYQFSMGTTGIITDLDVCLNIVHTWPGDLYVELTHDSTGTTVILMNRPGVTEQDFLGCDLPNVAVYLDDDELESIQDYCPPQALSGNFIPAAPLAGFVGENIGGTWTLLVSDRSQFDVGRLTGILLWPTVQ